MRAALSRLGAKVNPNAGTKVNVSNLSHDVLEDDLMDIFAAVGELIGSPALFYDRAGRSQGRGVVTYARQSDALTAVKEYHQRALDGKPMRVSSVRSGSGRVRTVRRFGVFGVRWFGGSVVRWFGGSVVSCCAPDDETLNQVHQG